MHTSLTYVASNNVAALLTMLAANKQIHCSLLLYLIRFLLFFLLLLFVNCCLVYGVCFVALAVLHPRIVTMKNGCDSGGGASTAAAASASASATAANDFHCNLQLAAFENIFAYSFVYCLLQFLLICMHTFVPWNAAIFCLKIAAYCCPFSFDLYK